MKQNGWSLIEALAAIVVVGIGITLFMKVQGGTSRTSATSSKILLAGKMIEKHLEDTRITISRDTVKNWPPRSLTIAPVPPDNIKLVSTVSSAFSPKDGALVANVVRMDIVVTWTLPTPDNLTVTTYVSKRF